MDGNGHGGLLAWVIDAAAAAILAVAVCAASVLLGAGAWALVAGALALAVALAALRLVRPETKSFAVAFRMPVDWDAALVDEAAPNPVAELVLTLEDRLVEPIGPLRLVPDQAARPTASEMLARIAAHLEGEAPAPAALPPSADIVPINADASAALRSALQDLRRSIG